MTISSLLAQRAPRRPDLIILFLAFVGCGPAGPGPGGTTPPPPTEVERDLREAPRRPATPVKVTYHRFFSTGTMRVDLEHRGNHQTESYRVLGMVREGPWPGSRTLLRDPFDYGAHWFEIRDVETGAIIFSRGYSSLFGEWQTTREAKTVTKVFSESLRLPMPRRLFDLAIFTRQKSGKLARIHEARLDPADPKVRLWVPRPDVEVMELHRSGDVERKLDLVILGDGYTQAEKEKLRRDAARFTEVLLSDETFGPLKDRINVRAVFVPSPVSGVSEPRRGILLKTPLGVSFNTFGSPRYMMTEANMALRDIAAHAPYDSLVLMANTSRYGGGGIYNLYATFPSDNEYDTYVFVHELGHSFGGLADEYYDSEVSYDDSEIYPKGVEPWEPNITRNLGARIKWADLVTPDALIPTPNLPKYEGVVGLFEGAGYSSKGLFRPQLSCKMKGKGHNPFCKVCSAAILSRIRVYSE